MKKRVRAIIVKDGLLLLIHRTKVDKEYWVFPGGGLEDSDVSPQSGLKRECLEELGVEVEVGEFFMERPSDSPVIDQIEFFYFCHIVNGEVGTGNGPEFTRNPKQSGTYEIQWIPVPNLAQKNVYPTDVRDQVTNSILLEKSNHHHE